jgi:DNA-binding NarL/FixJ family response regulator
VDIGVLRSEIAQDSLLRVVAILAGAKPELRLAALVNGLTSADDMARLRAAGAMGVILDTCQPSDLAEVLCRIARFEPVLPALVDVAASLTSELDCLSGLTPRERTISRMLAAGLKRGDVASALNISAWTVDSHRKAASRKMGPEGKDSG